MITYIRILSGLFKGKLLPYSYDTIARLFDIGVKYELVKVTK